MSHLIWTEEMFQLEKKCEHWSSFTMNHVRFFYTTIFGYVMMTNKPDNDKDHINDTRPDTLVSILIQFTSKIKLMKNLYI